MGLIKEKEMEMPVIDFSELDGENRTNTMSLLDHACDKWGFFMVCKYFNPQIKFLSNSMHM